MNSSNSLSDYQGSSWLLWPAVILIGIILAVFNKPQVKPPAGTLEWHIDQAYRQAGK